MRWSRIAVAAVAFSFPLAAASQPLSLARQYHTATLLPDGTVLVAGGGSQSTNTHAFGSSEIFDPKTGAWSAGPAHTPRARHRALLLPDGKILVVGGHTADFVNGHLREADLLDPAKRSGSRAGSPSVGRANATATLLADGKVLVGGGWAFPSDRDGLASAEVYDSITGTWSPTGSLHGGRSYHSATLLDDGRVLVTGGKQTDEHLGTTELYDPAAGIWAKGAPMNSARSHHSATLLRNGHVLVAGGMDARGPVGTAELYDPETATWTPVPPLAHPRVNATAVLLRNGKVLVSGGGAGEHVGAAELFDPATRKWQSAGSMRIARTDHTATLLSDGRVLHVGGEGKAGTLAESDVYDPATNTWSNTVPVPAARSRFDDAWSDARMLLRRGDLEGAARAAESASAIDATVPGPWDMLKAIHDGTGDLARARDIYLRAAAVRPAPRAEVRVPVPDGDPIAPGGAAFVAATRLRIRATDRPTSRVIAEARLNDTLEIRSLGPTSAGIRWMPRPQPSFVDAPAPVPVTGFVSREFLAPSALTRDWLVGRAADEPDARTRARLLERATAVDPADERLWITLRESAVEAEEWIMAVSATLAITALEARSPVVDLHLLFGCRGARRRAEVVRTRLGNVSRKPKDLCVEGVELLAPCARCAAPARDTSARGAVAAFPLRAGFKDGPWLQLRITGGSPEPARRLFLFSMRFNGTPEPPAWQARVETLRVLPQPLEPPPPGSRATLWVRSRYRGDEMYGVVEAANAGAARDAVAAHALNRGAVPFPESLAPGRAVAAPVSCVCPREPGPLSRARQLHRSVLLADGRVLVAGGYFGEMPDDRTATAEIFDPATGTWTATAPMSRARSDHSAVLLADKRVLVIGGGTPGESASSSGEIYDVSTSTWTPTGSMDERRKRFTTMLLADGRVLVSGGFDVDANRPSGSAEIFDPATGAWTTTGSMTGARYGHAATLLRDGRVLVSGGIDGTVQVSLEIYDPATETWSPAGRTLFPRAQHAAVLLRSGKVLIAGGSGVTRSGSAGGPTNTTELYDPATGASRRAGDLSCARDYLTVFTAARLHDGRVLVSGSLGCQESELFDPYTAAWSKASAARTPSSAHAATLLRDGRVLHSGGVDVKQWGRSAETPLLSRCALYDPRTDAWRETQR